MSETQINSLVVEANGPNDCYVGTMRGVLAEGIPIVSRDLETLEIRPTMIMFLKPYMRFLTCPGRLIHPFFQVLESIWILAGRGDVAWISKYLKNMERFSDGMPYFHAPYGTRMRQYGRRRNAHGNEEGNGIDQFKHCFRYLSMAPDTRHAVMSFWDPVADHYTTKTIDRPCNIAFHFLMRNNKLDLMIFNRSNDVHWGMFNANVVQFSVILEAMAMILGCRVGNQIHVSDSLHIYTDDKVGDNKAITDRVNARHSVSSDEPGFNMYEYVAARKFKIDGLKTGNPNALQELDSALISFFRLETLAYDGKPISVDALRFNYLRDALRLVRSYRCLKVLNDLPRAMNELVDVEADDIYVTCMEYLMRFVKEEDKINTTSFVRASLEQRLGERVSPEDRRRIFNYVISH